LLLRAIELQLKALHLEEMNRIEVKEEYSQRIVQLYDGLEEAHKILTDAKYQLLKSVEKNFPGRIFKYFNPLHALKGYSEFPDINMLGEIAKKLLTIRAEKLGFKEHKNSFMCNIWKRIHNFSVNKI